MSLGVSGPVLLITRHLIGKPLMGWSLPTDIKKKGSHEFSKTIDIW
jgi:hypothetical protein